MVERFIIQRALTKQVLTYDLPGVARGAIGRQLSAVGTLPLKIGAGAVLQVAADGLPMFGEWQTLVTLDDDGQIRFRGIVTAMDWDGATWNVTVSGMATYPHGTPYEGDAWYGAEVDPASIVARLWAHVQSFPDSDLGVTVVGTTRARVGSFSTQRRIAAESAYDAAVKTYNAENKTLQGLRKVVADTRKVAATRRTARANASKDVTAAKKAVTAAKTALTAAKKTKDPAKIAAAQATLNQANAALSDRQATLDQATLSLGSANNIIASQQADVDAQAKVVAAAKAVKDTRSDAKSAAQQAESDDGGAYALEPWEVQDCGQLINDLAETTPFDWVEEHYWTKQSIGTLGGSPIEVDVPQTRIRIAYPRTGRRLSGDTDPSFVQGVNITVTLKPTTKGEDLANSVYGIGAGEGAGSLRRSITVRNGKLRRVASFQAKDIKTKQVLDTRLRTELTARQETLVVESITVANHTNSKRGTYSIGDDIFVQGDVPHFGRFELWHRIVSISENPDDSTELTLERTDSFTYGQGVDG
jgi:hypothetical protein